MIDDIDFGYYKYKSKIPTEADCIKEYPITDYIRDLIENNLIPWEIEMEDEKPKLINGLGVLLI